MPVYKYDSNGEWQIWSHSQNLKKGKPLRQHGRWTLHWPGNSFGVEWAQGANYCMLSVCFQDMAVGDGVLSFSIGIPKVYALWCHLERARWIERLPGVDWVGTYNSGERELSVRVHHGSIWWTLWRHPDISKSHDWRNSNFNPMDFVFGRKESTKHTILQPQEIFIHLPEGYYKGTISLVKIEWKRPWSFQKESIIRGEIEVPNGIPIPGKGENSWDMDDDCLYSGSYPAKSVEEAIEALRASVFRDRQKYASSDWIPEGGWPSHCITN